MITLKNVVEEIQKCKKLVASCQNEALQLQERFRLIQNEINKNTIRIELLSEQRDLIINSGEERE